MGLAGAVKATNFLRTDTTHYVQTPNGRSGAKVHVQNSEPLKIFHISTTDGHLVQTRELPSVNKAAADLYGLSYTEQVLKKELYKNAPHRNQPVMDHAAKHFEPDPITAENAYSPQIKNSTASRRAVLSAIEGGSNFMNPPAAATKLAIGGGIIAATGKLIPESSLSNFTLHTIPGLRHLVDNPADTLAVKYGRWSELTSAGRTFKAGLDSKVDSSLERIKSMDFTETVQAYGFHGDVSTSNYLKKDLSTLSSESSDLDLFMRHALKEADNKIYNALNARLLEHGYVTKRIPTEFKESGWDESLRIFFKKNPPHTYKLRPEHLQDAQEKTKLLQEGDLSQLPIAKQAELKVWDKDPVDFYRAMERTDPELTIRVKQSILEEYPAPRSNEYDVRASELFTAQRQAKIELSGIRKPFAEIEARITAIKSDIQVANAAQVLTRDQGFIPPQGLADKIDRLNKQLSIEEAALKNLDTTELNNAADKFFDTNTDYNAYVNRMNARFY